MKSRRFMCPQIEEPSLPYRRASRNGVVQHSEIWPPIRREERAERRTAHIAELRKRASEADAKLKRLYNAIENGIVDLSDTMLKDRVAELKAIRDQARADAERAEGAIERLGPSNHR